MNDATSCLTSSEAVRARSLDTMAKKVADSAARLQQLEDSTVEQARALREERGNPFAPRPCELASINDIEIQTRSETLTARVYVPQSDSPQSDKEQPQAALVFYHGGGYVLGSVEQYDTVAQQLAFHSGCIVVSVEYRLAPDTKIMDIHEDGFDAYRWIYEHADELGIDRHRIAVGGDSAGGNLSVAVVLACKRDQFPMPAFQLLIYPSIDLPMSHASVDEFAHGYFLTRAGMNWFRSHYLETPEQADDEQLAYLKSDLTGLPSAYLVTAGFDPLRDEGKAFADRLAEFDVAVTHVCYTDMIHGFISFAGGIPTAMQSLQEMSRVLEKALATDC